jgi:mono/diheme cytochrome c family protein
MKNSVLGIYTAALIVLTTLVSFERNDFDLKASIERGKEVYAIHCTSCHMDNGEGMENVFPPLAKSDYLMADKKRSIQQVINGMSGEIKVNGKLYNGEMPPFPLSDQEVSDVLNYIRNSWGNKGGAVKPEEVAAERK